MTLIKLLIPNRFTILALSKHEFELGFQSRLHLKCVCSAIAEHKCSILKSGFRSDLGGKSIHSSQERSQACLLDLVPLKARMSSSEYLEMLRNPKVLISCSVALVERTLFVFRLLDTEREKYKRSSLYGHRA